MLSCFLFVFFSPMRCVTKFPGCLCQREESCCFVDVLLNHVPFFLLWKVVKCFRRWRLWWRTSSSAKTQLVLKSQHCSLGKCAIRGDLLFFFCTCCGDTEDVHTPRFYLHWIYLVTRMWNLRQVVNSINMAGNCCFLKGSVRLETPPLTQSEIFKRSTDKFTYI